VKTCITLSSRAAQMSEYMVVAGAAAGRADLVTAQLLLRCFYVNRRLHLPQPAALGAAVRLAADGAAAPPATPAAKAQRMFLLVDLLGSVAKIAQTRPPAPAPAAGAAGAAQASGGAGAPGELGAGGAAPAAPAQAPQPQRQGQGSGPWSDEARGRRAGVPAGVDPEDVAALGTAALLGLLAGGPRHPRQMHFLPVTLRNLGILGAGLVEPDLAAAALALAGAEAAGYNDMQLDQAAAALQLWRGAPCALSQGLRSDGRAGPAARRAACSRPGLVWGVSSSGGAKAGARAASSPLRTLPVCRLSLERLAVLGQRICTRRRRAGLVRGLPNPSAHDLMWAAARLDRARAGRRAGCGGRRADLPRGGAARGGAADARGAQQPHLGVRAAG